MRSYKTCRVLGEIAGDVLRVWSAERARTFWVHGWMGRDAGTRDRYVPTLYLNGFSMESHETSRVLGEMEGRFERAASAESVRAFPAHCC